VKYVGLLLTVLALGALFYFAYGKRGDVSGDAPAEASSLGAPAPSDVARNAKAAKAYTERQVCLADCAADNRTCAAIATEATAVSACVKAKVDCEERCPSDAR
jgi:hypothetical protein